MKNKGFYFKYDLKMQAENPEAEIMIYGEITPEKWSEETAEITAKEFDKLLKDAKASGATSLKLRINSPGGSVWQAVAMRTMLLNSTFEQVNVDIEGICASAATFFVCLPNARVRIAEGSEFMVHNPSAIMYGTAADMEKLADRMHKLESDQHRMYADRTGQSEEQIKQWMDEETWFTADEAVQAGFCDETIKSAAIAACVDAEAFELMQTAYRHVPEKVKPKEMPLADEHISNADGQAASLEASENTDSREIPAEEEDTDMDIRELTPEELKQGNPSLYEHVMQEGAKEERERICDIEDLTPAGYEEMAETAKREGTSATAFMKQLVKAQREKGAEYLRERKSETAPAETVKGGVSEDNDQTEEKELEQFAKDARELGLQQRNLTDGMY